MSRDERDIEQTLRSLPLRRPSNRLEDRVMGEIHGENPARRPGRPGSRPARWAGLLNVASAAAAMLALGLSITAVVRTMPGDRPAASPGAAVDRGPAMGREAEPENRLTDGLPREADEYRGEVRGELTGSGRSRSRGRGRRHVLPDGAFDPMSRFRGELMRKPLDEPFGRPANRSPTNGHYFDTRPGVPSLDRSNGDRKQIQ